MRAAALPGVDLTYCLNIHPGEGWDDNFAAIKTEAAAVRDKVSPGEPFGLGLRWSALAVAELSRPGELAKFKHYLDAQGMYAVTVNAFPYGRFSGGEVKASVYAPDWRSRDRLDYSLQAAGLLAGLLPERGRGCLSTVPGSYKRWISSEDDLRAMVDNLAELAFGLSSLESRTGRTIMLGLEQEPDCYLESTADLIDFFTGPLLDWGASYLERVNGVSRSDAAGMLHRHLGACFDTAHFAVAFETPADSLRRLAAAGIAISKIQVSAALRLIPSAANLRRLAEFADQVYLHQTRIRTRDGGTIRFPDLPEALAAPHDFSTQLEWRSHYHVPLFLDAYGGLESTASELDAGFFQAVRDVGVERLEIETYTFGVLPPELRKLAVSDSIAAEYRWLLDGINA